MGWLLVSTKVEGVKVPTQSQRKASPCIAMASNCITFILLFYPLLRIINIQINHFNNVNNVLTLIYIIIINGEIVAEIEVTDNFTDRSYIHEKGDVECFREGNFGDFHRDHRNGPSKRRKCRGNIHWTDVHLFGNTFACEHNNYYVSVITNSYK